VNHPELHQKLRLTTICHDTPLGYLPIYDPSKGNLNFEYIICHLETINCSTHSIGTGESNMPGPYIDGAPYSPDFFNKVRILYSFDDVDLSEGTLDEYAPVVRFTFNDPTGS
jgi:hypothetical protein